MLLHPSVFGGSGRDLEDRAPRSGCYQERPTRSQATSPGIHSVLIFESSRVTSFDPHFGQGGAGLSEVARYSSYFSWQASHRYS